MPRNAKKHLARSMAYNAQKTSREVHQLSKRKAPSRCDKALNGTLTLRDRSSESGAICIPEVAIYQAGHRKSNQVTAR